MRQTIVAYVLVDDYDEECARSGGDCVIDVEEEGYNLWSVTGACECRNTNRDEAKTCSHLAMHEACAF